MCSLQLLYISSILPFFSLKILGIFRKQCTKDNFTRDELQIIWNQTPTLNSENSKTVGRREVVWKGWGRCASRSQQGQGPWPECTITPYTTLHQFPNFPSLVLVSDFVSFVTISRGCLIRVWKMACFASHKWNSFTPWYFYCRSRKIMFNAGDGSTEQVFIKKRYF